MFQGPFSSSGMMIDSSTAQQHPAGMQHTRTSDSNRKESFDWEINGQAQRLTPPAARLELVWNQRDLNLFGTEEGRRRYC